MDADNSVRLLTFKRLKHFLLKYTCVAEFDPLLDIMLENETRVIIYIAAVSYLKEEIKLLGYLIRTPRRQPSQ